MTETVKFAFSLPKPVFDAFENRTGEEESRGKALMRDVLYRYAAEHLDLPDSTFDLELYRSLTQDVADAAERITDEEGWHEDITLRAIRDCQARPDWIDGYRRLINGNEFATRNRVKTSVNQNFGQYVKLRLKARNKTDAKGNRMTLQVNGDLVRSVTLLLQA